MAQELNDDIWSLYLYAMKSPMTRQKYIGRLNKFFDFLDLEGPTPEEKSKCFILKSKEKDTQWTFSSILKFMQFQLERVQKRETTGSTVNNYLKSIKLFCLVLYNRLVILFNLEPYPHGSDPSIRLFCSCFTISNNFYHTDFF